MNKANKRYMLISVFEREIATEIFATHEEAYAQMMNELKEEFDEYGDGDWNDVLNGESFEEFSFNDNWAWSNLDDDCNCDWKIVEI